MVIENRSKFTLAGSGEEPEWIFWSSRGTKMFYILILSDNYIICQASPNKRSDSSLKVSFRIVLIFEIMLMFYILNKQN